MASRLRRLVLALLLVMAFAAPGRAAYVFKNSISAGSSNGLGFTTGTVDMSGADLIVCGLNSYTAVTIVTLSDNNGNAYSYRTTYNGGASDGFLRLAYVQGAGVGKSGQTFTVTEPGGTAYPAVACLGFSGSAATPFDAENGFSLGGSQSSAQPGSVTPAAANELFVTAINDNFGGQGPFTINSSFVSPPQEYVAHTSNNLGLAVTYKIKTDATAENPTWTFTGASSSGDLTQAAFKVSTATPSSGTGNKRRKLTAVFGE